MFILLTKQIRFCYGGQFVTFEFAVLCLMTQLALTYAWFENGGVYFNIIKDAHKTYTPLLQNIFVFVFTKTLEFVNNIGMRTGSLGNLKPTHILSYNCVWNVLLSM